MENEITVLQQLADGIRQKIAEGRLCAERATRNFLEVGRMLNEAKAMLPHGEFCEWVQKNCGFSQQYACRLVLAAEKFPEENLNLSLNLNFSKIVALLEIKDDDARREFIAAHSVEDMSGAAIKKAIKAAKGDEPPQNDVTPHPNGESRSTDVQIVSDGESRIATKTKTVRKLFTAVCAIEIMPETEQERDELMEMADRLQCAANRLRKMANGEKLD